MAGPATAPAQRRQAEAVPTEDPYGILAACGPEGPQFASQLLETLALGTVFPPASRAVEPPAAGAPPPAPPPPGDCRPDARPDGARPGDVCPECRCPLVVCEIEYGCPSCHAVFEAADLAEVLPVSTPTEPGAGALRGRLRIVGADAGWFQPDLDRSNPGEYSETQKKTTYAELKRFNKEYGDRGGNPFPLDVLNDVAENYNVIQQTSVKRSMMKRSILSALLFHSCISRGFTRTKAEVAGFAGLPNHGIARGDDYLRSIDEDKGLEIDMNCPRLGPLIATTFSQLDLDHEAYAPLRGAVAAIVECADANFVGIQSVPRSKVIAAACEVLARGRALLRKADPGARPPTDSDVVMKCGIRRHTITRFRKELAEYHSVFAPVYAAHGLPSGPIDEVAAEGPPPPGDAVEGPPPPGDATGPA